MRGDAVDDTARQFFEMVLPNVADEHDPNTGEVLAPAYLNTHWSGRAAHGGKYWDGRAATSIDDLVRSAFWAHQHGDKDIYVCMSSQRKAEPKTSKAGNKYLKAHRFAQDAARIRSLFIDVDVKEKAYESIGAAFAAFKEFSDKVGLPIPSAVVMSGSGGFHAHWALDQDLSPEEWQPLAFALANAINQHGLIADTQCTVDVARILRVPGTLNRKTEPPTQVKLLSIGNRVSLEQMTALLEPYKAAHTPSRAAPGQLFEQPGPIAAALTGNAAGANDALGAGVTSGVTDKPPIGAVAKVCPWIARELGTGGKDTPQPLWFLVGSLASFVEDGREAFHQMSNQHPGYTVAHTDELYDRVSKAKSERDMGWPQCKKVAAYGCKDCATCPLFPQGKSPLNFALPAPEPNAPDSPLPKNYSRNADGVVMFNATSDEGVQSSIEVCHYPILQGWLSNNPWTFHFIAKTEMGKKTTVEVPTEVIFAKDGFNKYLGSKGFFLNETQYKRMKEFFVSWLQQLQQHKESVISASTFGWSIIDGKTEGFTYAGRVWTPDGDRPAANPNAVLQYQYTPKGNLQPWADSAKVVYEQQRPALDAILAVAFAAPLVRFTGFGGLILNAYSAESGIGKTTAMKVSQSVWASPVLAMQGLDDTSNSVLNKMGQLRSLPMYWDEIKSEEQVKRFCSIVFNLTGGREKTRLNADSTLKNSGTWQTMMVSASNDTLIDGMTRAVGSTTAGLHRLFEYVVEKPATVTRDLGSVQRLLGQLDENYGHAGLAYAKFLGVHHARVEREVADIQDELYTEAGVKQEERMWLATMAVLLKGAAYANELGLTDIDVPRLRDFLMGVLAKMRGEVDKSPSDLNNDMAVSTILAEFLNNTRGRNTLITNRVWIARGKPPKGAVNILTDLSKIGEVAVQIGREDGILRISSTFLSRWMAERGYSRHTFVKRLSEEFGTKVVNGKLGSGTDMAAAMEYLIEMDMNHPKLANFLEAPT